MDELTLFHDRQDAGQKLAFKLEKYKNNPNTLVLALPRGGIPVAYPVAKHLHLPLDIFVVRKLGAPSQEELAIGAIASGSIKYFNENIVSALGLSQAEINAVVEKEKNELIRREIKYREGEKFPDISGKTIILVDDGIATGATAFTAITALKTLAPKKIVLATPVAPASMINKIKSMADDFVCLHLAPIFHAVGQFYEIFDQTQDSEVKYFLEKTKKKK